MTLDEVGAALRITSGEAVPEPTRAILSRQIGVATAAVDAYAPDAEANTRAEAIIRMTGFLFDTQFQALNNNPIVNALSMSGAQALLSVSRVGESEAVR